VDDLSVFVRARLDEAQRDAGAMEHDRDWDDDYRSCLAARVGTMADRGYGEADCTCDLAGRKARALREVEAKRAIVARHVPMPVRGIEAESCRYCRRIWPCPDVRSIAAVDGGHPDYRPEWKP